MEESSFYKLFKLLENKEIRLFQKYMTVMYEEQKTALKVLTYFVKHASKIETLKKLTMEQAHLKIFGRPIDEDSKDRKYFQNTLSDLHLWLKEFLMNEMLRKNKFSRDLAWIIAVMEDSRLSKENIKDRKVRVRTNKEPGANSYDYLKGMVTNFLIMQRSKPSLDINIIQQYSTDLDGYYLMLKLRAACEIANIQNLNPNQFSEIMPDSLIMMIKKAPASQQPLFRIYLDVYQLLIYQTDDIYDRITNQLVFYFNQFPPEERQVIMRYLLNFASRKIKAGEPSYWFKSHQLNMLTYQDEPAATEKSSPGSYLNVISVASYANDFEWAKKFMHERGERLPADKKSETMLVAKGIIFFGKKDFDTVKALLLPVKFEDTLNAIRARTILLMADYESGFDISEMLAACIRFETFLLYYEPEYQKVTPSFWIFSQMLKMLVKARDPKEKLLKMLEGDKMIASRDWLVQKIDTYQQKYFRKSKK